MKYNPLLKVPEFGQSIWLDYLRRDMLESGELGRLIENDDLRGMTSNPQIFWKAIDGSDDYTGAVHTLAQQGKTREEIYRTLTVEDVQSAADIFRPVYDKFDGADGFVSLEVNPHLARNTDGTIKEAKELWKALNRPNVFIKVPATKEGLPAIRQLISEGINVNVTLLFGLERYREVAEAYISGLEDRVNKDKSLKNISSVASFFLSRIDVKVDPELEQLERKQSGIAVGEIKGQVAIASAKMAYHIYKEMFTSDRFRKLEKKGARPQRVLWASTSTKNPAYSDIKYVEALIGPETVNTVPQETLSAYRDHGQPANRLENDFDKAQRVLDRLKEFNIDINRVTSELIEEGIEKFNKPYDQTLESLERRMGEMKAGPVDPQEMLVADYNKSIKARIDELTKQQFSKRLWEKDVSLWTDDENTGKQIANSLGWLFVAGKMLPHVSDLKKFAAGVRKDDFKHVVLLGMGGSSLAPLVFSETFASGSDGLPLDVLDSTDPGTILNIEKQIPLKNTLFIVSSKSGTTTESLTFMEYFYHKVKDVKGDKAGENFVAITDPGSSLADTAKSRGFRKVFLNYQDIGGRYSALSYFGIVPAVLIGADIEKLLDRAERMAQANQRGDTKAANPAIELGTMIGELATQGCDKLTFLTSGSIESFGLWLEQLVAESTGKEGRGILPVAGETIGEPGVYAKDRIFVYFELKGDENKEDLSRVKALADAGHPVFIVRLQDKYDLGQEMMRWEIATATAGAVLNINPFDQPNVQESKDITKRILQAAINAGSLPQPDFESANSDDVLLDASDAHFEDGLMKFLSKIKEGDYVAIQAYLPESDDMNKGLHVMQHRLRDSLRAATTVGYGPRFLHSTGQYHKGGPNTGLFIQLGRESKENLAVPGKDYTFDLLINAQARGDLEALFKHKRRAIRINLGTDPENNLNHVLNVFAGTVQQQT